MEGLRWGYTESYTQNSPILLSLSLSHQLAVKLLYHKSILFEHMNDVV